MALTDRGIRAAGPGKHRDQSGHGLVLVVSPAGSKRWKQRIAIRGRKRELGLGGYPLVSLAAARKRARENAAAARDGRDPIAEREAAAAAAVTLEEAARTVHALYAPAWSAHHARDWLAALEFHVFPALGARAVGEIDVQDIAAVLEPVWTKRPVTGRRIAQSLSQIARWAIARGLRRDDPMYAARPLLPRSSRKPAPQRAVPFGAVPGVLERVRASSAREATKLAFEFMVLTAARPGEVLGATWGELDLEAALWAVPENRMKARREHRVPLSAGALEVLGAARALAGGAPAPGAVVFQAASGGPICSTAFVQMLRRLDVDAVAHGFRSSFRSWAAERTRVPREACELALAHAVPGVEGRYQRSDLLEQRRALMDRWSRFVSGEEPGVVVDIAAAAGGRR